MAGIPIISGLFDKAKSFVFGEKQAKITYQDHNYSNTSLCIVCGEKTGAGAAPVKEDIIIRSIRWVKNKLKNTRNNRLFVCRNCWAQYKKERQDYINGVLVWSMIVGIIFVLIAIGPLLTGGSYDLVSMIMMAFALFLFWVFTMIIQLFRYRPGTEYDLDNSASKTEPRNAHKPKPPVKKRGV